MQLEDLPTAFEPAELRRAADIALAEESIEGALHVLATALGKRAAPLIEADLHIAMLLATDQALCDYHLTTHGHAKANGPLGALWEMDGKRYPAAIEVFPDSVRPYLELRAGETQRSDVRARYFDFIWLRWHDFPSARRAHAAYLEAADGRELEDASPAMDAVDQLTRAAELSLGLGIEQPATIRTLRDEVMRGLSRDQSGYSFWIGKEAAALIAKDVDTARELIDVVATEADVRPEGRRHRQRSLLEVAEELAREIGAGEEANRIRLRRARSFEDEARERSSEGGLIEMAFLDDAAQLYAAAGCGADVQRLKPDLAQASMRSLDQMHVISSTVQVPNAVFAKAADELQAKYPDPSTLLLVFAQANGLWVHPDLLAERLDGAIKDNPVLHLVSHVSVTGDGRYQPDPEDDTDKREAQLTRQLATDTALQLAMALTVVHELRSRGVWSAENLVDAIRAIDPVQAAACEDGLRAFERGEVWLAAHALSPQLERAVRLAVIEGGGSPRSRARRGGLQWKSLEETLLEPEANVVLGEALSGSLLRLFVDPLGPNYRNEIAHGALDPGSDATPAAFLTILAILSLLVRTAAHRGKSDAAPSGVEPPVDTGPQA